MILVIRTQCMTNWAAQLWDGQGECPEQWRFTHGHEYMIEGIPNGVDPEEVIAATKISVHTDFEREWITGWTIEHDQYLSDYERGQLVQDGMITTPEPRIEYTDLVDFLEEMPYNTHM